MTKQTTPTVPVRKHPETSEFKNFVELISLYTDASNQLTAMETRANDDQLEIVDSIMGEYTKLQEVISKTEQALEVVARNHPEWFGEKSSVKTPYGTVKLISSSPLAVANEELSLALLEREPETEGFRPSDYIRVEKSLNLEALGALDDTILAKFKIRRDCKKNFSVTPAKLDMGKAVKAKAQEKKTAQPQATATADREVAATKRAA